jgi:hypothetical protein
LAAFLRRHDWRANLQRGSLVRGGKDLLVGSTPVRLRWPQAEPKRQRLGRRSFAMKEASLRSNRPGRRKAAIGHCAYLIARETVNDFTRRVLYDDGRFGVLGPVIFTEIVSYSARVFDRGNVVGQHDTIGIVDFPFIVLDDEEVAGHVIRANR